MKLSFRFKHGSSTPFETIERGTADLGSARLLSTAGLAVPHGNSTTWFQTACYCCAELNWPFPSSCLHLLQSESKCEDLCGGN